MTCVVGMIHKGDVYVGADSAGVGGLDIRDMSSKKVFRNGPMVIGYTSSFRMGQLLEHKLVIPNHPADVSDLKYMVVHFIDAVRVCLKESGYTKIDSNREEGGSFLVGYRGRLYRVDDDFQVGEERPGYSAVGCGADYAMGAMYVSGLKKPIERLRQALHAAGHFSAGVRGPYFIERLRAKK